MYGYQIQQNMQGQQVGFCNNATVHLPFGYSCNNQLTQQVVTGTLVSDGNGNLLTGSTYTQTDDPNSYECSSNHNATPNCPYKVPSGVAWSSTTNYLVGNEVDLKNSAAKLLTYQAVVNNVGVTPGVDNRTCYYNTGNNPPPACTWVEIYNSATGKNGSKNGTLTGKYTVQTNGSAVLQVTPSGETGSVSLAMVVPIALLAVGQEVPLVDLPTLGNGGVGSGAAVRVK